MQQTTNRFKTKKDEPIKVSQNDATILAGFGRFYLPPTGNYHPDAPKIPQAQFKISALASTYRYERTQATGKHDFDLGALTQMMLKKGRYEREKYFDLSQTYPSSYIDPTASLALSIKDRTLDDTIGTMNAFLAHAETYGVEVDDEQEDIFNLDSLAFAEKGPNTKTFHRMGTYLFKDIGRELNGWKNDRVSAFFEFGSGIPKKLTYL